MNRKASVMDIILWVVMAFIVIMFFAVWLFMHDTLTTTFASIPTQNGLNISQAADQTIGEVNRALIPGLHILTIMMMFAYGLSIFISNYFARGNPIFLFIHIAIVVVAIILSAIVSNVYETLYLSGQLSPTLMGFTGGSYILLHLPLWTAVIGVFGIIFLFIGIIRDREFGSGI